MKSHKYWSLGALFCMLGCIYSGIKKSMTAHKYFSGAAPISKGNSTTKVDPFPTSLVTEIVPPILSIIFFTIAMPSPVP